MNMGRRITGDFDVLDSNVELLSRDAGSDDGWEVTLPCTIPVAEVEIPIGKPERERMEYIYLIDERILKLKCSLGIPYAFITKIECPIGVKLADRINIVGPIGVPIVQSNRLITSIQFPIFDTEILDLYASLGIPLVQTIKLEASLGKTVDDSISRLKKIKEFLKNL